MVMAMRKIMVMNDDGNYDDGIASGYDDGDGGNNEDGGQCGQQ